MAESLLKQAQTIEELGYPTDLEPFNPDGLPPGEGRLAVPHFLSFSAIVNQISRTYKFQFDEALRHSRENALALKRDPVVRDALKARKTPTAMLSWHIEVDDENDPQQAELQDDLTDFINRIPHFQRLKMNLLDAIFYGRSAVQLTYKWDWSQGKKKLLVRDHIPVNGDKLVFNFGGQPGILVHGTYSGKTVLTDRGKAHMFAPEERESLIIHKHEVYDADFYEADLAGAIHGVGVRDEIYWFWFLKVKTFEHMMNYVERVGAGGFTIYYYDAGSSSSKDEVYKAAQEQLGNNTILFPRNREGKDLGAGIQRIEVSNAGAQLIQTLVKDYFDPMIREFIMGMKVEAEEGLTVGDGDAGMRAERLARITKYDAVNLEETLTADLLNIKIKYDWPGMEGKARFKFDVDRPDVKQIMEAAKLAYEMGGELDGTDLMDKLGLPQPEKGHKIWAKVPPMSPTATGSAPTGVPMIGQPGPEAGGQQQGPPDVQQVL